MTCRAPIWLALSICFAVAACAKDPNYGAGTGGSASAGKGGSTGGGGGAAAGSSGSAATSGSTGSGGRGGAGGSAGSGGSGAGRTGGSTGVAGTGGGAGTGGAGTGGGGAGTGGGVSGSAGATGAGGLAGTGAAGRGGTGGGSAGTGGRPPGTGVLQHHNHATRDGVFVNPLITKAAAAKMHLDPNFAKAYHYAGEIFAQPLIWSRSGNAYDLIIVASKAGHITAYETMGGGEVWDRLLGAPGVRPTTVCTPGAVGMIGTPIIDAATGILYVDAMTGGDVNKHQVFALDADTGAIQPGWPVDIDATARFGTIAFTSSTQNQRGALALLDGTVYIPYGGFGGDCGVYYGWIVGISTTNPANVTAWATRSTQSGIWAPAGIASDGESLFFATGNSATLTGWGDNEAVIRLHPSLLAAMGSDYFAPANWASLDALDQDLGGTAPVLFDVPGASPSSLLAIFGKDAKGYVLDRKKLGGIGAPLIVSPLLRDGAVGAHVTYRTAQGTYVVTRGPGYGCMSGYDTGHLVAVKLSATTPPALTVPWCNLIPDSKGTPTVTMSDAQGTDAVVWIVGNDERLHGMDGDIGWPVLDGAKTTDAIPSVSRYQAPIAWKGRIYVAGNTRLYAFTSN